MTDAPPEIGAGETDDLLPFVDLLEEAGAWLWSRGIRQWPPGSHQPQIPRLREMAESGALVIARSGGRLVGGCLLTATPGPAWSTRPAPAAYLSKLVVGRFDAGQGIGQRLVAWAEEWTRGRGLPRLRLDCWDGNQVLRRYYRDLGFSELEAASEGDFWVRLFEKRV